jgi:hypothetical protein
MIESGKKLSNCTAGWTRCANGDCKPQPGFCVGNSTDDDRKKVLAECQGTGQVMCNLFSGPKCVGAAACDPRKTSVIPACGVNEIRCQSGCIPGRRLRVCGDSACRATANAVLAKCATQPSATVVVTKALEACNATAAPTLNPTAAPSLASTIAPSQPPTSLNQTMSPTRAKMPRRLLGEPEKNRSTNGTVPPTASPSKPRDDSDANVDVCLKVLKEFMESTCIETVEPQSACKVADNTTLSLVQCKPGEVVCPGGMTCGKSLSDCSKWTAWEGCPAGTTQCSGNRLTCVTSLDQCQNATGCAVGLQFCGFRRNFTTGQKDATSVPICKAACGDFEPVGNIKPEAKVFNYLRTQPLEKDVSDASGSAIMRIKCGKGAINNTQSGGDNLELLVLPVPDSELTDGPFKVRFAARAVAAGPERDRQDA